MPHWWKSLGARLVLVCNKLKDFLLVPIVQKKKDIYFLDYNVRHTIGKAKAFFGNFSICLKAFCYLLSLGNKLRQVSADTVLNANYLKTELNDIFEIPYSGDCMHEFVVSTRKYKSLGGTALNIAKRLIDYKIHPPTICFPLLEEEAMMIEPTETEDLDSMNNLLDVFKKIITKLQDDPDLVKKAPLSVRVSRINELKAVKDPVLNELFAN